MSDEKKTIKETEEILIGVKEAFKAGKAIRDIVKDGVDMTDIPKAFELVKNQSDKLMIYEAAIKDAKLAKDELKDLDKEEILKLLMIVIDGVSEVDKA